MRHYGKKKRTTKNSQISSKISCIKFTGIKATPLKKLFKKSQLGMHWKFCVEIGSSTYSVLTEKLLSPQPKHNGFSAFIDNHVNPDWLSISSHNISPCYTQYAPLGILKNSAKLPKAPYWAFLFLWKIVLSLTKNNKRCEADNPQMYPHLPSAF